MASFYLFFSAALSFLVLDEHFLIVCANHNVMVTNLTVLSLSCIINISPCTFLIRTTVNQAPIHSIFQFLWCECSHHG